MKKIAINGLGRIGRLILRNYISDPPHNVQIFAANGLTPVDELAYITRYDSVHGRPSFPLGYVADYLKLGEQKGHHTQ